MAPFPSNERRVPFVFDGKIGQFQSKCFSPLGNETPKMSMIIHLQEFLSQIIRHFIIAF